MKTLFENSLYYGNDVYVTKEEVEECLRAIPQFAKKIEENGSGSFLADLFRAKVANMGYDMTNEAQPDISYRTGFTSIDYLMGYIAKEFNMETGKLDSYYNLGITDGSYVAIVGNSNVGKSTFAEQVIGNIIKRFKTSVAFIDSTEAGGMTETRRLHLAKLNKDEYRKKYIVRNSGVSAENIYKRIKTIADIKKDNPNQYIYDTGRKDMYGNPIMKLEPTLYLCDSIAGLLPEDMIDETELSGKSYGAQAANVVTQMFLGIVQIIKSANIIFIGTNHLAQDIQMTMFPKAPDLPWLKQGERIPKGRKATLFANHIMRLDQVKKLSPDEAYKIHGSIVNFSLVKSRTSGIKEPIRMVYDFVNGFDPWLSLLEYMRDKNLLYGGGASLSFDPEKTFKFSLGTFLDKFYSDEEFRRAFLINVIPYLKKIPIEVDERARDTRLEDFLDENLLYKV